MRPPMLNRILDHLAYDGAFVRPTNEELFDTAIIVVLIVVVVVL